MNHSATAIYHIYGRSDYAQPLAFIHAVPVAEGEQPDLPEGADWLEVVAFPQAAIIQVIPGPEEKTA